MTRNQIRIGDILQNEDGDIAYIRGIGPDSIGIYINGKKDSIMNDQLYHWSYVNPIKDNRIINNETFAVRFKQFLEWIPKEWWMSQPHYYEEYEYMMHVAKCLLKYQIETVTKETEINYLKNLKLL